MPKKSPESQSTAELRPQPVHMRLDDLTDEVWRDVMLLYYAAAYSRYTPDERDLYYTSADARQQLNEGFRFGSDFSMNSKLQPRTDDGQGLMFDFYLNTLRGELPPAQVQRAEAARDAFTTSVNEYLITHGLAIEPEK